MRNILKLLALVLAATLLSSCVSQKPGIFGKLPELYRQAASSRQNLEEMLASASLSDDKAALAMHEFSTGLKEIQKQIEKEAETLKGTMVPVSASNACGFKANRAFIELVKPGIVTQVIIKIPAEADSTVMANNQAYLTFTDEDNEPVAKSLAWYDKNAKAIRLEIPFALNDNENAVSPNAFCHYDMAMGIKLVSAAEYNADNSEQQSSTLLKIEKFDSLNPAAGNNDTSSATNSKDSTENQEPEEVAWSGPLLSPKGVGAVTLGAPLTDLPDHMEGVYDHKHLEKQFDEMEEEPMLTASFSVKGKTVITALGDEQGNIVFITVETPDIKVEIDGHFIGVGDPIPELMRLKGVKPDKSGAFAATYHGISFAPTPTGLIHSISIGAVW